MREARFACRTRLSPAFPVRSYSLSNSVTFIPIHPTLASFPRLSNEYPIRPGLAYLAGAAYLAYLAGQAGLIAQPILRTLLEQPISLSGPDIRSSVSVSTLRKVYCFPSVSTPLGCFPSVSTLRLPISLDPAPLGCFPWPAPLGCFPWPAHASRTSLGQAAGQEIRWTGPSSWCRAAAAQALRSSQQLMQESSWTSQPS